MNIVAKLVIRKITAAFRYEIESNSEDAERIIEIDKTLPPKRILCQ